MPREIIKCEDGSFSIRSERFQQTYHSETGALAESRYVYLESGLEYYLAQHPGTGSVRIVEAGLGTGLDVLLAAVKAETGHFDIDYHVIELYPLEEDEWKKLEYGGLLSETGIDIDNIFHRIHSCRWNESVRISEHLTLHKIKGDISDLSLYAEEALRETDVVFFDAFSPDCQPELWSYEIFKALYDNLTEGGVLTTYSAKGMVKENLRAAGFFVKRLKGIGHKRHIVRAVKTASGTKSPERL